MGFAQFSDFVSLKNDATRIAGVDLFSDYESALDLVRFTKRRNKFRGINSVKMPRSYTNSHGTTFYSQFKVSDYYRISSMLLSYCALLGSGHFGSRHSKHTRRFV